MRYEYNKTAIVAAWRKDKKTGWGTRIAKKFNIPSAVVLNVVYAHRRKRKEQNQKYRAKVMQDPQKITWKSKRVTLRSFQSFVAYAAPNVVAKAFALVEG